MIISHKYKFVFIGLPFSASSAISKDLHLNYEGRSFLRKHSVYYEFIKHATAEEKKYFVFAVLRNPMQILVTMYEKMKSNKKGNFTNPNLFLENGGHITKKQREIFNFINNEKATFQQYFKKFYRYPYDNLASLTVKNCNYVIKYDQIEEDYLKALKKTGVANPKPLPVANKTFGKKEDFSAYYTEDVKKHAVFIFGPFFKKYGYSFPKSWGQVSFSKTASLQFKILGFLRKIKHKYFKKHKKEIEIKGSLYGEIQRDTLS